MEQTTDESGYVYIAGGTASANLVFCDGDIGADGGAYVAVFAPDGMLQSLTIHTCRLDAILHLYHQC